MSQEPKFDENIPQKLDYAEISKKVKELKGKYPDAYQRVLDRRDRNQDISALTIIAIHCLQILAEQDIKVKADIQTALALQKKLNWIKQYQKRTSFWVETALSIFEKEIRIDAGFQE